MALKFLPGMVASEATSAPLIAWPCTTAAPSSSRAAKVSPSGSIARLSSLLKNGAQGASMNVMWPRTMFSGRRR